MIYRPTSNGVFRLVTTNKEFIPISDAKPEHFVSLEWLLQNGAKQIGRGKNLAYFIPDWEGN